MSERKRIYLCLAHMSEDGAEQRYVKEAFDTNWVVPLGPNVNGFEKDLEEFIASPQPSPKGEGNLKSHPSGGDIEGACKRVVALSAGTAAVHLALIACGVGPGGTVLNIDKGQWHSLKCLESGTILLEAKDGAYRPLDEDEIWNEDKD